MKLVPLVAAGFVAVASLSFAIPAEAASAPAKVTTTSSDVVQAHYRGGHWDRGQRHARPSKLSPRRLSHMLRRKGIQPIRFFDTHGRVYQLTARSHRGTHLKVAVNAYNGDIVAMKRIGHGKNWQRGGHQDHQRGQQDRGGRNDGWRHR